MSQELKYPIDKPSFIAAWIDYTGAQSVLESDFISTVVDLINDAYRHGYEAGRQAA